MKKNSPDIQNENCNLQDEMTKRIIPHLPAKISENKELIKKFLVLFEATWYSVTLLGCMECELLHYERAEAEKVVKAVKQAILDFGISLEEVNAELRKVSPEYFFIHKYSDGQECNESIGGCLTQKRLFMAISNILVAKNSTKKRAKIPSNISAKHRKA